MASSINGTMGKSTIEYTMLMPFIVDLPMGI